MSKCKDEPIKGLQGIYTNPNTFDLYNNMTIDIVNMYGIDWMYLKSDLADLDSLFGEAPNQSYADYKTIKLYLDNNTGFEGDRVMFSKLGMTIDDELTLIGSKTEIDKILGHPPRENDLLFFSFANKLFEIKWIEAETNKVSFYFLGKTTIYRFNCRLFEYSHENMSSDIDTVLGLNNLADSVQPFVEEELKEEIATVIDDTEKDLI